MSKIKSICMYFPPPPRSHGRRGCPPPRGRPPRPAPLSGRAAPRLNPARDNALAEGTGKRPLRRRRVSRRGKNRRDPRPQTGGRAAVTSGSAPRSPPHPRRRGRCQAAAAAAASPPGSPCARRGPGRRFSPLPPLA